MVIAVDFDGTLVQGKEALHGARDAINNLREQGHKIMIFSCNNTQWIERVLRENDIRYDYIWPEGKPLYDALIDDRNIAFDGDWPKAVAEVERRAERKGDCDDLWGV